VKYILLITLCAFSFLTNGQNRELISKLKQDLERAENQKRFGLLNELAWEYRWALPDSTIHYASEAFVLGQNLKLSKGIAEPLNYIGVAYNYKGDRIKAYEHYDQALKISTGQKDSSQIAYSNNNLGRLFFEQGIMSRSYEYFTRSLSIFESIKDRSGLAYTYQSLANLYKSQRDFPKAEQNHLKAYRIRLELGNTRDIMSALGQIGRLHQDNNDHEKALFYLHKADSAGRVIHDEINLAEIATLIADSYLHQNQLNKAESMCSQGLSVITKLNNVRMLPQAYLTMGQIKFTKQDFAASRKYIVEALTIASRIKDLNSKMESHYWLWKLSEKENNASEVMKNQNQYLILKDSVKDLDVARQVERLQFEIEIGRKEQENELLKAHQAKNDAVIEQQKLQNIILIIVIASISVLALAQWISIRRRRLINEKLAEQNQFIQRQRQEIIEQNEKLFRRNQELSDLNYEKDTLMSIVAHDLKSPLNRINGMIEIMELEGGLSTDQRTYLQMIKEATRSGLDLIKDLLDVHMLQENIVPHHAAFDMSAFVLEKTKEFEPSADAKGIHLQISRVENEEVNLDVNYLSRIVDNLLSNAIKFSKPDSVVEIGAGKENGNFWISVKDQGPGFSEKDRNQLFQRFKKLSARPTGGESSNGLGLAIVKTLVDRLNGSIELISEPEKGSEFVVRLPLIPVSTEVVSS
jgi:signal transduction histidine kinase